jgi:hypothetical protein
MSPQKAVDARCWCSYFVLIAAHEVIVVGCPCGRSVEYHKGFLQRRHRVPSDFLVYDLQVRL